MISGSFILPGAGSQNVDTALQKQAGCFNDHITTLTTFRTSVRGPLQMHFKVTGRNLVQAGDSLTDVLRFVSVVWL